MHTGFYILKEVFFHVLVFKKFFLVLMFKYAGSLLTRSSITISFMYLYYHQDINSKHLSGFGFNSLDFTNY